MTFHVIYTVSRRGVDEERTRDTEVPREEDSRKLSVP